MTKKILIIFALFLLLGLNFVTAFDWEDGTLQAYFNFNSDFSDSLGINNATNNSAVINSTVKFLGAGSLYCDGVGDYATWSNQSWRDIGTGDFSLSFWFKTRNEGAGSISSPFQVMKSTSDYEGVNIFWDYKYTQPTTNDIMFRVSGANNVRDVGSSEMIDEAWHHFVGVRNNTDLLLYIDGSLVNSTSVASVDFNVITTPAVFCINADGFSTQAWRGNMDEFGFWNKSLSLLEVQELYNAGSGLEYLSEGTGISVILTSPSSQATLYNNTIHFVSNVTPTNYNTTNATTYVFYQNGTLYSSNTTTIVGNESNTSYITLSGFSSSNDFLWNTLACGSNETDTNCFWASSNYTFYWRPFSVNNLTYESNVYETTTQDFEINITTIESVLSVSAKMYYNGTSYTSSTSCENNNCRISNTIDIPTIKGSGTEEKTFYWEINSYDGSQSVTSTTGEYEQNVSRIYLESCNATLTTQALNLSVWDEQNDSRITNVDFQGVILKYYLGTGSTYRNTTFSNSSTSEHQLCISPADQEYFITGQVDYDDNASVYTKRNYYFDEFSVTNTSQDLKLYLLKSSDAISFIVKVQDRTIQALVGAYVYIERYVPSEDRYKIVQVIYTDDNGEGVGLYETETAEYRHRVIYNSEEVLVTSKQKVVPKTVPYTITLTVTGDTTLPWADLVENESITANINYNRTTDLITFTYVDTSEAVGYGRLYVYMENLTNGDEISICDESSILSSAIMTCNVSGMDGTLTAIGYLGDSSSSNEIVALEKFKVSDADDIFGSYGLIFVFLLILVVSFIFVFSPTTSIISAVFGLWMFNIIGIFYVQPLFLYAITAIGIILVVVINK